MTPDDELERLKAQYGMTDLDSMTKAQMNLNRALKTRKIDHKTYNDEIASLKEDLETIYDNGKTKSTGIIAILNEMNLSKWMEKRY